MPSIIWKMLPGIAALAAIVSGQQAAPGAQAQGTPLKLVPSEPLTDPRPTQPVEPRRTSAASEPGVRPAILNLKPPGDPIYLVEELSADPENDKWRTYQRPKVEMFSRDSERVAIQGYDVLSYLEKRAEKGRKEFSLEHGGVHWYFSNADHREQFRRDPERFLPQYGGFCAYSVSRGYPATADPRAFALEGGKLYLFFDKAVQTVWEQERSSRISAADRNWPRLHVPN